MTDVKHTAGGWGQVKNTSKWHYIDATTKLSACGRWMRLGPTSDLEDDNDGSADNCVACRRKVKAMRAKASGETP